MLLAGFRRHSARNFEIERAAIEQLQLRLYPQIVAAAANFVVGVTFKGGRVKTIRARMD